MVVHTGPGVPEPPAAHSRFASRVTAQYALMSEFLPKRSNMRSLRLLFTAVLLLAPVCAQEITSPEKFFGFQLGADKKMARWDKIVDYYGVLEKQSGGQRN